MTDEEIISAIGFDTATPELKSKTAESVRTIVELRVISILGELITDEQEQKLDELRIGDSKLMWEWLKHEVVGVDVSEVYEAALKDYIDEYKQNEFIPQ